MKKLISVFFVLSCAAFAACTTATVTDTLTNPDGSNFNGNIIIKWPAYTCAGKDYVEQKLKILILGGALNVTLPATDRTDEKILFTVNGRYEDNSPLVEIWSTSSVVNPNTLATVRMPGSAGAGLLTVKHENVVIGSPRSKINFDDSAGIVSIISDNGTQINVTNAADTAVMLSRATDQAGTDKKCVSATGNDTYTCALNPTLLTYSNGGCLVLIPDTANTGAAALDVDTLGSLAIKTHAGATLADSDIPANIGTTICLNFDHTFWTIQGDGGGGGGIPNPIVQDLLFTDATYDIGKPGASRPKNLDISGVGTIPTLVSGVVNTGFGEVRLRYLEDTLNNKGYLDTQVAGFNFLGENRVTTNVNLAVRAVASQSANVFECLASGGTTTTCSITPAGDLMATTFNTKTNCSDSAGAAACGSAAAGSFVMDVGATTVVVSTTAVTANSQIFVMFDSSLGTRLGVTCNTTPATVAFLSVSARTAATSFTAAISGTIGTNPGCFSYHIVN